MGPARQPQAHPGESALTRKGTTARTHTRARTHAHGRPPDGAHAETPPMLFPFLFQAEEPAGTDGCPCQMWSGYYKPGGAEPSDHYVEGGSDDSPIDPERVDLEVPHPYSCSPYG